VQSYVRHLPEVGPEALGKPGVYHQVVHHGGWCGIFKGRDCNCDPHVKFYAEPKRTQRRGTYGTSSEIKSSR
jgi:hypothetical protein